MLVKIRLFSSFFLISILLWSCNKDQSQIVPYVKVNITANLYYPQFSALNAPGNAVIFPYEGYNRNGVIIFRNSIEEYTAYDATCPQHIETKTAIKLDDNGSGGQATCPYCKTVYNFYSYGTASKGYPLQRYNVNISGNVLIIYN